MQFGMAEEGIVIEGHLAIQSDQTAFPGHHQGIDFRHGRIQIAEGAVAPQGEGNKLMDLLEGQSAQTKGQFPCLKRLKSNGGFHFHLKYGFGVGFDDILDLHAPLGGGDDPNALGFAVQDEPQINFSLKGFGYFDIQTFHDLAFGAGLMSDKSGAKESFGDFGDFMRSLAQAHPSRLAPSTRVNLGFDGPQFASEFRRGLGGLSWGIDHFAARDGNSMLRQQFLGLILMNIHVTSC